MQECFFVLCMVILLGRTISINDKNNDKKFPSLIVVTVATDETDGFRRLKQSADVFGIEIQVYGLGEKWTGGDTRIEQVHKAHLLGEN